jgi:hypothetical protein
MGNEAIAPLMAVNGWSTERASMSTGHLADDPLDHVDRDQRDRRDPNSPRQ